MRDFDYATAPPSLKLLVSAFLIAAVLGLGVAGLQVYVRTGMTAAGAVAHYRGDEAAMMYPRSFAEMVETTHAHVLAMPMLALILGLGLTLTRASERLKVAATIALFAGVFLELLVPWLVRYGPPGAAHLLTVAGMSLSAGLLTCVAVPLYEMWAAGRPQMAGDRVQVAVPRVRQLPTSGTDS